MWAVFLATAMTTALSQEVDRIDFEGQGWIGAGEVAVGEALGTPALTMRSGSATLEEVEFVDGSISFDVLVTGHRSFVGVAFRSDPTGNHSEHFYLRPHNENRFDALQYTPVEHGLSAWQLYPECNARAALAANEWLHVELQVRGRELEVFLGESADPVLSCRLRGSRSAGGVRLTAFFPPQDSAEDVRSAFANVVVEPDSASGSPSKQSLGQTADAVAQGFIPVWTLGPAHSASGQVVTELSERRRPEELCVACDERGRVNLARHRGLPAGASAGTVVARTNIEADVAGSVPLSFGFSDRASVFLNGQLICTSDNSYRSRSQRYLGVMTADHLTLYLPLEQGNNELAIAVTESFGGWGLTARLPEGPWRSSIPE